MEREYRIHIEDREPTPTSPTVYTVTVWKVNIDPKGVIAGEFSSINHERAINKAGKWIKQDWSR